MLDVLWLAATWLLAAVYVRGAAWSSLLSPLEIGVASVAGGTAAAVWAVFLVSSLFGSLSVFSVLVATCLLAAAAYARYTAAPRPLPRLALARSQWVGCALLGACLLPTWRLYSTRMLPEDEYGNIIAAGSCYGDLPIHMNIAQSFLIGANINFSWSNMHSTIFAGAPLTYPFLPDFHAAIFVVLGGTLRRAFLWTGVGMVLALFAAIYSLALRMSKSPAAGLIAVVLTVCAGGLGAIRWVMYNGWDAALAADVIQHDPTGEWKYLWFAFIPHILLPQRGATFAYPITLLILIFVWVATSYMPARASSAVAGPAVLTTGSGAGAGAVPTAARSDAAAAAVHANDGMPTLLQARSLLLHAAVLAGGLPMIQAHAFIAAGIIIGTIFLLDAHKWIASPKLLLSWLLAGIVAVALSAPQLVLFRKTVNEGFYGKFMTFGWLFHNYEFGQPYGMAGFLRFWWYSLGAAVPLFLAAMLLFSSEACAGYSAARRLHKDDGARAVDQFAAQRVQAGVLMLAASSVAALPTVPGKDHREHAQLCDAAVLHKVEAWMRVPLNAVASALGDVAHLARLDLHNDVLARVNACNVLSPTGRALDALKMCIGAWAVFMVANYINFQPWDRDNAKIYYIWVFVASCVSASLLVLPFETLLGSKLANARVAAASTPWNAAATLTSLRGLTADATAPTVMPTAASTLERVAKPVGPGAAAPSSLDALLCGTVHPGAHSALSLGNLLAALAAPVLLLLTSSSGTLSLWHEYHDMGGVLVDRDAQAIGRMINEVVPPTATVMHANHHVQPSSCVAGRASFVAYYGWVSNHGYNSYERLGDRDYVLDHLLSTNDAHALALCNKWKVEWVLGEHMKHLDASPPTNHLGHPTFQGGRVTRVAHAGRFELYKVRY